LHILTFSLLNIEPNDDMHSGEIYLVIDDFITNEIRDIIVDLHKKSMSMLDTSDGKYCKAIYLQRFCINVQYNLLHYVGLTLDDVDNDIKWDDSVAGSKEDAINNENTYHGLKYDAAYIKLNQLVNMYHIIFCCRRFYRPCRFNQCKRRT